VPPGYDRKRITVKFQDGLSFEIDRNGGLLGSHGLGLGPVRASEVLRQIAKAGGRWRSAANIDRSRLEELRSRAQFARRREIADLSSYFVLTLPAATSAELVMDALNGLAEVELASPAPLPVPAPSVPDFQPLQGYLSPTPNGENFQFAWTIPGGTGEGVTICFTCNDALAIYRDVTSRGFKASRPAVGNGMWVTKLL